MSSPNGQFITPPPGLEIGPRAVPAGWPADVVPGQLIASADINQIKTSVYQWPGDVAAGGHNLTGVNLLGVTLLDIKPAGAGHAAYIYDTGGALAWLFASNGDLQASGGRLLTGVGQINLGGGSGQINSVARLQFNDASIQTTAYNGVAANQTPWTQDIDAARHTLWNTRAVEVIPLDGTSLRLSIYNTSAALDWAITGTGDLVSNTARAIGGVLSVTASSVIQAQNFYSPDGGVYTSMHHIVGSGGVFAWSANSNPWDATDLALHRAGAGQLRIASGGADADLLLRNVTASGNVSISGTAHAGYFAGLSDKAAVWDIHLAVASDGDIRFSNDASFYGPSDLVLTRGGAGILYLSNPLTGNYMYFQPGYGVRLPSSDSVRWSNSAVASGVSDCALRRSASGGAEVADETLGGFGDFRARDVWAARDIHGANAVFAGQVILDATTIMMRPYSGAFQFVGTGANGRADLYAARVFASEIIDPTATFGIINTARCFVGSGGVNTPGVVYSAERVESGKGFVSYGQVGLGDVGGASGQYTVDITTPTGQKTMWFVGGLLTSVTG